jgi:opacity protein-like surface antigen
MNDALIALTLFGLVATPVAATGSDDDPPSRMFRFNAFGTLGEVHSSQPHADFTSTNFQPSGAGYSHEWSSDVDTRLGAQLTANFTPQLSAVLQVIVEQTFDDTYKPAVEWANIKYQVTPDFDLRIGRIVVPTFLVSDTLKVGYANHWVRPPLEVYDLNPISNSDGADAKYTLHFGDVANTLRAMYGKQLRYRFPAATTSNVKTLWGVFDSVEYRSGLLSVSYVRGKIDLEPSIPLIGAFRQFGPQGISIANRYELVNKAATILTFGASYDPGEWFAMGEWTRVDAHSFVGIGTGWYVSGGYRFGAVTPYLTYGKMKNSLNSDPGLDVSTLPPALAGTAIALNAGLNTILARRPAQKTASVGARWDFMKNVALKLQYDHTNLGAGSPGTLINLQPGFGFGSTVNLYNITIDFVW